MSADSLTARQTSAADLLASKGLLLPGVAPHDLVADAVLGADLERWEGLDEGTLTDYEEALQAYIAVCADARCHKRFTQAWQRHASAPFAEALMELVATYRSYRPTASPDKVVDPPAVDEEHAGLASLDDADAGLSNSDSALQTEPFSQTGGCNDDRGGAEEARAERVDMEEFRVVEPETSNAEVEEAEEGGGASGSGTVDATSAAPRLEGAVEAERPDAAGALSREVEMVAARTEQVESQEKADSPTVVTKGVAPLESDPIGAKGAAVSMNATAPVPAAPPVPIPQLAVDVTDPTTTSSDLSSAAVASATPAAPPPLSFSQPSRVRNVSSAETASVSPCSGILSPGASHGFAFVSCHSAGHWVRQRLSARVCKLVAARRWDISEVVLIGSPPQPQRTREQSHVGNPPLAAQFGRRKDSKMSKISRSLSWNTRRKQKAGATADADSAGTTAGLELAGVAPSSSVSNALPRPSFAGVGGQPVPSVDSSSAEPRFSVAGGEMMSEEATAEGKTPRMMEVVHSVPRFST